MSEINYPHDRLVSLQEETEIFFESKGYQTDNIKHCYVTTVSGITYQLTYYQMMQTVSYIKFYSGNFINYPELLLVIEFNSGEKLRLGYTSQSLWIPC